MGEERRNRTQTPRKQTVANASVNENETWTNLSLLWQMIQLKLRHRAFLQPRAEIPDFFSSICASRFVQRWAHF